jgi:hyperosmotically inducible periplasmic protein
MQFRKTLYATGFALALATLAGPVIADTAGQNVTEARQETQIWTTYALNPHLRAMDIKVSVQGGKATLTGKVDEDVNRDLAKQIALGVDGISEVDNRLAIDADYTPPARAERSFGDVVEDASITTAVKSKLLWSKHADGLATDVDTRSGKVTLTGKADSGAAKDLAGRLAANTRGVVSVDNKLVVAAAKPAAGAKAELAAVEAKRTISDSWITSKVKSTFAYSKNVDGSDISVTTKEGVVTLSGKVDSGAERDLAVELARNVRGVKAVHAKGLKS